MALSNQMWNKNIIFVFMNKIFFIIIILVTCFLQAEAEQIDSLWLQLNKAMNNREFFIEKKKQKIENIRQALNISDILPHQEYDINKKMYEEYKKYCADSALVYVKKNREIAFALNEPFLIDETAIQLAWLYSTIGLYVESYELLNGINKDRLVNNLLLQYYKTYSDLYSHYGQSNNSQIFYRKSEFYRDTLLLYSDTLSFEYRMEYVSRRVFGGFDSKDTLLKLLNEVDENDPDHGNVTWLIGFMYQHIMSDIETSKKYYTLSAISDIKNCINDNASLQSLAILYFQEGNVKIAYNLIRQAVNDALFCNVRYRISEASMYYPIINAAYQDLEEKQMSRLYTLLFIISILVIVLIVSVNIFYRQNKVLSRMRKQLSDTNKQLESLNQELTLINKDLQKSNLIKEEYIAHFFDVCSAYVDKLETYRRMFTKHAKKDRIDEMLKVLDFNVIEGELDELYRKFDTIFLNLYPTFVDDFNTLRPESDRIAIRQGELMNTELRIFALVRLGISDSVKIASFLRYSLSAIYNYRVKARKCCNMSKKDFDEVLLTLGNSK